MSYSEPLINQPRVLFLSVGVGAILCLLYIIIQGVCRLLGEGRLSYYLADGLFCAVFALVSFFFMVLYGGGRVRLHLMLGEGAGFFAFYFSLGRYIYGFTVSAVEFLKRVAVFLLSPFAVLLSFIKKKCMPLKVKTATLFKKAGTHKEAVEKKKKKFYLFGKIHLKNPYKSV